MSNKAKPTHRAYATKTNPDGKDSWREIGALWPHKDGNGFHLRLDLIPRDQDVITIRKVVPKRPKAELAKIS